LKITKRFVDSVTIPKKTANGGSTSDIFRDEVLVGFALRVGSGGTKSFIVEGRVNGKVRRTTLGKYPTTTCEQARDLALDQLSQMAKGKDPAREADAARARKITLAEVFDDYLKTHPDLSPSTVNDYERIMREAFKDWQSESIINIRKQDIVKRHRKLGETSQARANNAMRVLRAMINHAMNQYEEPDGSPIIHINPVSQLSKTRGWFKTKRRETWIKPFQLPAWYQATLTLSLDTSRDYFHLLLFTGLRKGEASRIRWEDVDLVNRTLLIPETKNKRLHALPLSDYLYQLFARRFQYRVNEWVFPSTRSEGGHLVEPKSAMRRIVSLSDVEFTFHDLRRTFITIAESLEISIYALKRLLNHKEGNDVTAGYIIMDIERLRDPMERISNRILEYIEQDPDKSVVSIDSRKNKN